MLCLDVAILSVLLCRSLPGIVRLRRGAATLYTTSQHSGPARTESSKDRSRGRFLSSSALVYPRPPHQL